MRIIYEVQPTKMTNADYSVIVWPYAFGQFRIQLTNVAIGDPFAPAPHGAIVREMCTYDKQTMLDTVEKIRGSDDPEAFCRTLEKPWNCEYQGGRIRLDNIPEDRIETPQ